MMMKIKKNEKKNAMTMMKPNNSLFVSGVQRGGPCGWRYWFTPGALTGPLTQLHGAWCDDVAADLLSFALGSLDGQTVIWGSREEQVLQL